MNTCSIYRTLWVQTMFKESKRSKSSLTLWHYEKHHNLVQTRKNQRLRAKRREIPSLTPGWLQLVRPAYCQTHRLFLRRSIPPKRVLWTSVLLLINRPWRLTTTPSMRRLKWDSVKRDASSSSPRKRTNSNCCSKKRWKLSRILDKVRLTSRASLSIPSITGKRITFYPFNRTTSRKCAISRRCKTCNNTSYSQFNYRRNSMPKIRKMSIWERRTNSVTKR